MPVSQITLAKTLGTLLSLYAIEAIGATDTIFVNGFETPLNKVAQRDIEIAVTDDAIWTSLKTRCDRDLNTLITDIYAGFDWRQAAQDYGLCYAAGTQRGDAKAPQYSKKAVAILKTLARTFPVIAPNQNHQFLAFGDGSTKTFTLPMAPLSGTVVRLFSNVADVKTFTYSGPTRADVTADFSAAHLYPVLRVASTASGAVSNAAPEFPREVDWHVSMRDDVNGTTHYNVLHWLGSHHPSGTYYVATNLHQDDTAIGQSAYSVSGSSLTFAAAPAAGTALFVEYLGADYTQTSNLAGGIESVKPDGPGYNMRAMNVGLAYGYDALRQSPDLTTSLRQEFYTVLNGQIDWYTAAGYEGPNLCSQLCAVGNYFIRGYLTGAVFTAYATDDENPRAKPGGDLKPLARNLLMQTFQAMQTYLPGAYGPQGQYSEGTNQDMLQLYDLWKRLTGLDGAPEDLASQLEWTSNLVPATIHGTKPNRVTFYDGGDWDNLPATPLVESMQAFIKYQHNHAMAPFARQLLADTGHSVAGPITDYKSGSAQFPLSYLAKASGPVYARSDWGTSAVWLSLSAGPLVMDHQHRDEGHFTLQRGADYLLINAGGYQYEFINTLPYHNTLGFDDRGAGDHIVYPPGQGEWGPDTAITHYDEQTTFVYAKADIADAYVNNDGTTNSVLSALRTLVYVRPNMVFVHDAMQVANPNVKKIFNVNFNSPSVARVGDVFRSNHGSSTLFMRSMLPANPSPVITTLNYNGGSHNVSNYQLTTTGQTSGRFVNLFELTESARPSMSASSYLTTSDGREEGAEFDMGSRRYIVLAPITAAPVLNTSPLVYSVAQACPCTHVLTGLLPSKTYHVTVSGGTGSDFQQASDAQGVLSFKTEDLGTTSVQIQ